MPSVPPPLNAYPLLDRGQRRDLRSIPESNRKVGAWLILARDDDSGAWEQRLLPCRGCAEGRVPCIDSASHPSYALRGCLNCHHNGLACRQNEDAKEDGRGQLIDPIRGEPQPQPAERKLGIGDKGSETRPDLLSAGMIDDGWPAPKVKVEYYGKEDPRPHASPAPENDGQERLRNWVQTSSWAAEPVPTNAPSPGRPSDDPPSYTPPSKVPFQPPQPLGIARPGLVQSHPMVNRALPQARRFAPPPRGQQPYRRGLVRDIIIEAKCSGDPRVNLILGDPLGRASRNPCDLNIKILDPGPDGPAGRLIGPRGASWLVLVFDGHGGIVFHAEGHRGALNRANGIMRGALPFQAAECPQLSGVNGGVFAVAIAVWLSRGWREDYALDFRINEQLARTEHYKLLDGQQPTFTAVKVVGSARLQSFTGPLRGKVMGGW